MAEINFKGLIEFAELTKALQFVYSQVKHQDLLNSDSAKQQDTIKKALEKINKEMAEIQVLSKSFIIGLQSINTIEHKLISWSERFKGLEEGNYSVKTKMIALEDHLENQISVIKKENKKENKILQKKVMDEVENRVKAVENKACNEMAAVRSEISEANREFFKSIEEILLKCKENTKEIQNSQLKNRFEREDTGERISFSAMNSKVFALETQVSQIMHSLQKKTPETVQGNQDILELREEFDGKLASALDLVSKQPDEVIKELKRLESFQADTDLNGIYQKFSLLDEEVKQMKKRNSMFEKVLPRFSLEKPQNLPDLLENSAESEDEQKSMDFFTHFSESLEKIHKTLPLLMYKSELEEIFLDFSRKIKAKQKKITENENFTPKILEQEQRINGLWRTLAQTSDSIKILSEQFLKSEQNLAEFQEMTLKSFESKEKSTEPLPNLSKHIKSESPSLQNEQYFRSMLLSLRNDILSVQEELERLKRANVSTPIMDAQLELAEFQEPLQISMLQGILKQHDSAIRMLANKAFPPNAEEKSGKLLEATVYLTRLEDLKKEMKEILAKQENSKNLSTNDLEIIENILQSLNSKIGKEELSQMADKDELHKIYRMLKRRIDELAAAVKNRESPHREDAFFLKKKFSMDCASCGQTILDKQENKIGYEYWNKFPMKNPIYCASYSRLLNSLVPSPTGGLMLPKKSKSRISFDEASGAKTVKSKSRNISSRMFLKK